MIGILGGMGTQAGLDFCSKLAKINRGKSDQKYPIFLLYNKSNIPDRKQNLNKYNRLNISEIADLSINDTLARTIITSATTLLALLSIFILGGEILRGFSFAMILGVVIGTYSSIFVASPMLKFFKVTYKTLEKEEEKIVP